MSRSSNAKHSVTIDRAYKGRDQSIIAEEMMITEYQILKNKQRDSSATSPVNSQTKKWKWAKITSLNQPAENIAPKQ